MILEVDEVGYARAAAAFHAGNRAAAAVLADLATGLAGTGRMAGDDAGGSTFAAAYDGAAGEAVAGLADVAAAFATLGGLTEQSDAEHRRSEARAIIPGAVVDPGCVEPPAAAYLRPQPFRPPSSLGGDPPALTPEENWVLDHVEGFVWPDADVDRLRGAARRWRATAAALDGLADCCGVAGDALLTQRSPEIPLAVAAADELRTIIRGLATDCGDLAQQGEAYAGEVGAGHARIRALLREVLALVVEGVVIAVALSAVTAGIGAAGGTTAIALRVAATAPRFHALLLALRAATSGIAASLRATHAAVAARRARLERFLRLPPRTERGGIGPVLRSVRVRDAAGVRRVVDQLARGSNKPHRVVGSQKELEDLFRTLARHGEEVPRATYAGTTVRLPDGTIVAMRNHSRSGGWTIEIEGLLAKPVKVHIHG